MTMEEAIKLLVNATYSNEWQGNEDLTTAHNMAIEALEQESKAGRWGRKTKVDAYDIAGGKTWGIKCQCDRCDFTTIVVEDFGYYKYCPNCGCRMESEDEAEK